MPESSAFRDTVSGSPRVRVWAVFLLLFAITGIPGLLVMHSTELLTGDRLVAYLPGPLVQANSAPAPPAPSGTVRSSVGRVHPLTETTVPAAVPGAVISAITGLALNIWVSLGAIIGLTVLSWPLLQKAWSQGYKSMVLTSIGTVLLVVSMFAFRSAAPSSLLHQITDYLGPNTSQLENATFGVSLDSSTFYAAGDIGVALTFGALSAICAVGALAAASQFGWKAPSATRRMEIIRGALLLGSAVFVTTLIMMSTRFEAMLAHYPSDTGDNVDANVAAARGFIGSMINAWGIAMSLSLATAYVPAALVLYPDYRSEKRTRAARGVSAPAGKAADAKPGSKTEGAEAMRDDESVLPFLDRKTLGVFVRFAAIVAPAALGQILEVLQTS